MANPTTINDIEARFRPLTSEETVTAAALLDDAWSLLLARRPSLDDDIAAVAVSTATAVRVVSAMVIRVLRNPEGMRSEQIDDYSYTRDNMLSAGLLYATAEELSDLTIGGSRHFSSVRLVAHGEL